MSETKPYGTVLIKAAKIMDCLEASPDQTLQGIAQATGMTASTTIKILDTLVMIGYVQKDKDKTYRLGAKLIRYANKSIEQIDLSEVTLPYLEKLQQTIDETIHLGMSNKSDIEQLNDALMEKIAKSEKTEVAPSKKTEIADKKHMVSQFALPFKPLKVFSFLKSGSLEAFS